MTLVDLLNEFHIVPQFPPSVVKWAETIPAEVSEADLGNRIDLTDKLIFTIDGDDAKDFDDAVSLEVLENGNYYLGVHIADVTHYVTENSPMDRAAFARGTSVYLIDTVIPMLPFELSNELCSLKPDEVRLTVSVFMEITKQGKLLDYKIFNSFIKSKARMTYANVTKILDGDKTLCEKYSDLVLTLKNMQELAKALNEKRVRAGSIEFKTHESKITLDKKGVPTAVEKYPITVSNNIIEEFMLSANVAVATHLSRLGLPCVYRVHEEPDFERIERLAKILPELDVEFRFKPDMKPKDFQKILTSVEGLDTSSVVNYLVLRSMSRARYSEKNLGHFGLSFSDYCHFTSPIRRYPDIVVHRILKESLKGKVNEKRLSYFKELAISASVTSSITESNATDAEFRWKDIKKAEYMEGHIAEKHTAIITHITSSGFFAELENTVEGFVPARTIEDDIYMMTENGLAMEGGRTKRRFVIGDRIEIKVVAADPTNGKVDFEVVGTRPIKPQRRKQGKGRGNKKPLTKGEKRQLKKFKAEYREERQQKRDLRDRADTERMIFENAVVYELYELLANRKHLNKAERGFVGVTLKDLAAVVSMPAFKGHIFKTDEISLKDALISALKNTENTIEIICESLEIEGSKELIEFAAEYVCSALRYFDAALKENKLNLTKRENEYDGIMKKMMARRKNEK